MNAEQIFESIEKAAARADRKPDAITLCAVTKKQPIGRVLEYATYCAKHNKKIVLGENYVQEYQEKISLLPPGVEAHLIGHLQSNKAKDAAKIFDCIETIDSEKLARKVSDEAIRNEKRIPIFIQVNVSQDVAKSGVEAGAVEKLGEYCVTLPGVEFLGMMTITELYDNPEKARKDFAAMRLLRDQISLKLGLSKCLLSMGMSDDYTYAIEEGADIVRVGSALFGARV